MPTLPTVGAELGGSGTDVDPQVNQEALEGSGETLKTASWTSFLSPSYLFGEMQNAYLPSALRTMGAVQALVAPKPSLSDFWEMAKKHEKTSQDYVPRLLESAAKYFKSTKFTDITSAMNHIVDATATFRDNISGALDAHNVTFDAFSRELEGIFAAIMKDIENIPPPDQAPSHTEREEMVNKILDDTTQELTKLAARYRIEQETDTYLAVLKPQVRALIVAVGSVNEQHPTLLPMLAFSVAALLIPESWILRPLLSLFGFGPLGPIKGSLAAWMQSYFWGATVGAGSWFSLLQAAGMGVIPTWAGFVIKVPLLVGGLLAGLPPYFSRRSTGRVAPHE